MRKIKLIFALVITAITAMGQNPYPMNYPRINMGINSSSLVDIKGQLSLHNVLTGGSGDSVAVFQGGKFRKVPRSQFALSLQDATTFGNITDKATYFSGFGHVDTEVEAVVVSNSPGFGRIGKQKNGGTIGAIRFMDGYSDFSYDNTGADNINLRLRTEDLSVSGAIHNSRLEIKPGINTNESATLNQINQLTRNSKSFGIAQKVGDDLYISTKYGTTNDLLILFKKCMFNELYTFQRVGIIANSGSNPDVTKIQSTPTTILNEVGSDNIGPINITGYGFIGGNHSLGNDNVTKTAITNSFKIYADGIEITGSEIVPYRELKILVENTIYDPALLPGTLSGLITENVTYTIIDKSIDVSVNHEYLVYHGRYQKS